MVCVNVLWMAMKLQIDGSITGNQRPSRFRRRRDKKINKKQIGNEWK